MEVKVHWHLRRVLPLSWVVSWSLHLLEGQCTKLSEDGRANMVKTSSAKLFCYSSLPSRRAHRSHELNPSPKAPPATLHIRIEFLSPKPASNMYIAEVHPEFLSEALLGAKTVYAFPTRSQLMRWCWCWCSRPRGLSKPLLQAELAQLELAVTRMVLSTWTLNDWTHSFICHTFQGQTLSGAWHLEKRKSLFSKNSWICIEDKTVIL